MSVLEDTGYELNTDVRELGNTAIEDKIPQEMIRTYLSESNKGSIEYRLAEDDRVSDIAGINIIFERFVDKLRFLLSKYQLNEHRRVILRCVRLILED